MDNLAVPKATTMEEWMEMMNLTSRGTNEDRRMTMKAERISVDVAKVTYLTRLFTLTLNKNTMVWLQMVQTVLNFTQEGGEADPENQDPTTIWEKSLILTPNSWRKIFKTKATFNPSFTKNSQKIFFLSKINSSLRYFFLIPKLAQNRTINLMLKAGIQKTHAMKTSFITSCKTFTTSLKVNSTGLKSIWLKRGFTVGKAPST
jgi:hypothetical protein